MTRLIRSTTNRRRVLKWLGLGGGVTALSAVSGLIPGTPGEATAAPANTGDPVLIGTQNNADATTTLAATSQSQMGPLLIADARILPDGTGLLGLASGQSSTGVNGSSDGGYGVVGNGGGGIDVWVGGPSGSGRLWVSPQYAAGAPTSYNAHKGELIVDGAGDVWVCVETGMPGRWIRLATTTESAIKLFPAPIRVLDTRGNGAPITNGAQPLAGGATLVAQITGTSVGGVFVPPGATALVGNLTALPYQGGDLIIWADGVSRPNVSNLNYSAGVNIANSCIVRLSDAGKVDIYAHLGKTHVILDIAGYMV